MLQFEQEMRERMFLKQIVDIFLLSGLKQIVILFITLMN